MNLLKSFFLTFALGIFVFSNAFAQDGFNLEDFGMPESNFPTPPNTDGATAIVNYNLDYMDLNDGSNIIHIDDASSAKLLAFYYKKDDTYTLIAQTKEGKDIPVRITPSEENPGCVFAHIGRDWINVICSDYMSYTEKRPEIKKVEPKKDEKKEDKKDEIGRAHV